MDMTEIYFFANGPRDLPPAIRVPFAALDQDPVWDWNWANLWPANCAEGQRACQIERLSDQMLARKPEV